MLYAVVLIAVSASKLKIYHIKNHLINISCYCSFISHRRDSDKIMMLV